MLASRSHSARTAQRRAALFCHPQVECLEDRRLMAGLDVPQLSSRPGAAATLYLDFDGHFESSWGTFSNVTSPAYDRDGDATTFSATELSSINEIWTRVAEDFAPFNVNVTTVAPSSFAHGSTLTVVIGGSWSDWYGTQVNGVSFLNGFSGTDPNVAYVFSTNLGTGFPKWVAEQTSHEAGHAFGLLNQAKWNGTTLQSALNPGANGWAPIMGSGNFATRTTWYNGTTAVSPTSFQDDMAILAGATNGFGYVADDYGDTLATAAQLPITGSSVNLSGLIGQNGDQDWFKFTTADGNVSFNLGVAAFGANLDSVLELRDASGQVVTIADNSTAGVFTSALSANVAPGTYYLVVRSSGGYGNVGQYTLTGNVVPGVVTAPKISVQADGAALSSGGEVTFGSTLVGTPVTHTFTVQNFGNGDLTLSPLDPSGFPAGFSLVSNVSATTLAPGASTTFTVQLDATTAGTFGGTIHVLSNDASQGSFDIGLDGTVTTPVVLAPEIRICSDSTSLTSGDTVTFGPTLIGTAVTHTFTVQNTGTGDLLLSQLDPSSLPAGFTLVQALGATTLHPTDTTTFVVRFDATAHGTFGGVLHVLSNDADEGSFDINLSGTVAAPQIQVSAGGAQLSSGDTLNFGPTPVGTPVTQTLIISNVGDGDLSVTGFDGTQLPAGFSLVTGFGNTTVFPGGSIILTVQLDAAAAGTYGGAIHVLSSDANTGSFDVTLSGLVAAPKIAVSTGGSALNSGDALDFGTTVLGTPLTQTVTIQNVGTSVLTLSPVDGTSLPAGFSLVSNVGATNLDAGSSTTFTVQFDATAAGTFVGVIHVLSNDASFGSFDIALSGVVTAPHLAVSVGGVGFDSGDTLDFGTTQTGTPVTQTITVQNTGDATLVLTPLDPAAFPAGFSLVNNFATATLAPGASTTFTIQLDASSAGSMCGVIHILSNDASQGSFDIALSGVANNPAPPPPPPFVQTIDNGDAGFTTTGIWHVQNDKGGYQGDSQFADKTDKLASATWTFRCLPAGHYRVSITEPASSSYASNASFAVSDGSRLLGTVTVNQRVATNSFVADGSSWQKLGTFNLCSGTLVVQLTNRANGQVVADAVRIERVDGGDDPTPPNPSPSNITIHKHGKDAKSDDHDSGKHGHENHPAPPRPAPAHQEKQKSTSSTTPAPNKVDVHLLHNLAVDVAHHHAKAKSHK